MPSTLTRFDAKGERERGDLRFFEEFLRSLLGEDLLSLEARASCSSAIYISRIASSILGDMADSFLI